MTTVKNKSVSDGKGPPGNHATRTKIAAQIDAQVAEGPNTTNEFFHRATLPLSGAILLLATVAHTTISLSPPCRALPRASCRACKVHLGSRHFHNEPRHVPRNPKDLLPYESYTADPKWLVRFIALGLALVLAAPLRAVAARRLRRWIQRHTKEDRKTKRKAKGIHDVLGSVGLWSLPGITLNVGQMFIVAGYAIVALICIILHAPLIENPNRAGFLVLAPPPPVFLFASKNSPLTALP
ncbi:hypothetical protein C8R44DRAFT_738261 [Mycena epipterygia]|nr:hypothetical protein C8R44DRAFT_738261 [Mycena epipterygia]